MADKNVLYVSYEDIVDMHSPAKICWEQNGIKLGRGYYYDSEMIPDWILDEYYELYPGLRSRELSNG